MFMCPLDFQMVNMHLVYSLILRTFPWDAILFGIWKFSLFPYIYCKNFFVCITAVKYQLSNLELMSYSASWSHFTISHHRSKTMVPRQQSLETQFKFKQWRESIMWPRGSKMWPGVGVWWCFQCSNAILSWLYQYSQKLSCSFWNSGSVSGGN